jgi:cytochrome c oxidase assembly factor CtaG
MPRIAQVSLALIGSAGLVLSAAQLALAHGGIPPDPSLTTIVTAWSPELLPWIGMIAAAVGYLSAVRVVDRRHPQTPVPAWRIGCWLAGVGAIGLALVSAIDVYATSLFSVHMVQHLLLSMVAPPLLALGAPVTLALRAAPATVRRSLLLPILHSRLVHAVSWPPVGWTLFALVMWATHFSPLFDAALENPVLHDLEHLLYLGAGLLFWWPVIGADPVRWRLGPAARLVYLAAQMPLNTAVGLAIYFAPTVLYHHYATLGRPWGPDPVTDQQVAGIIMWGAGDVILLTALVLAVAAGLQKIERRSRRIEERAARYEERASLDGS